MNRKEQRSIKAISAAFVSQRSPGSTTYSKPSPKKLATAARKLKDIDLSVLVEMAYAWASVEAIVEAWKRRK